MKGLHKKENNYPIIYQQASALKTASALILEGVGTFKGLFVTTDGTNDVTILIYDGEDALGTKLIPSIIVNGETNNFNFRLDAGIMVETGIYVSVTVANGGTCEYQVYYED